MSQWIPITKATLYDTKLAALIDAFDSVALGAGQRDRSTGIIQGVVDDIRRKVASCRQNSLDADLTRLPKGLKSIALTLITAKLKIAIEQELSEDERREVITANANLNRVASGEDVVDQPDNPVAAPMEPTFTPPSFGTRGVTLKARQFDDSTQDG